jgi:Transposase DDE domain
MPPTPLFPAWRSRLARLGSGTAPAFRQVRAYTLCQLETCFAPCLPTDLFPKAAESKNSRDRDYTRGRTFWSMVWQGFNPEASGREVVRQLQALFRLEGGRKISKKDGAYCRAKHRLPLAEFPKALSASAQAADQQAPTFTLLGGRPIKPVDGSALTLWDSRKNRKAYPPLIDPKKPEKPSFPMLRIVVLFSLLSGALLAVAQGNLQTSELALLSLLTSYLNPQDIVVGDRGFGHYVVIAWLQQAFKVDFIGRSTRRLDGRRRLRRLGRNDWLFQWTKPTRPSAWLSALQWAGLPTELTVRVVKGSCYQKGFRMRQVKLVTTLLDPERYPAREILQAYLRRWRLEMCLDDLKTTLQMDLLRSRSPEMAQKELYARLTAHNLLRYLRAKAATEHSVSLERISFKGTLDTVRHFSQALARVRSKAKRQELWSELLDSLAEDLLPERPGRREPRAVKRKKNKYPRLDAPRRKFRDHPKRNTRRKNARLRQLGLAM